MYALQPLGASAASAPAAPAPGQPRQVSDQDKQLAAEWLRRIKGALDLKVNKEAAKVFKRNRELLRGVDPDNEDGEQKRRFRSNIFFAELARMRPAVYAKDPEFSVQPTLGVPKQQLPAVQAFGQACEALLRQMLVKDAHLKKRAKRILTAAYATRLGWWKLCWQDGTPRDPNIQNRIKDTTDNLERLRAQRQQLDDASAGGPDIDLQIAQLQQGLDGLQAQAEVFVGRGLTLDFVLPEDIVVIDESIREVMDYPRAGAMAHRVWMTRDKYRAQYGYAPEKATGYTEAGGELGQAKTAVSAGGQRPGSELLCVWEVWDQDTNRIYQVCDGEEGFCAPPFSPDWTPQRWYPFHALAFNEGESYYPLSDVELIEPLVREYNESRDDFVTDRRDCRPVNIVRKGGALKPDDIEKIRNRNGMDLIMVEGVGSSPLSNDLFMGQLGQIKPENYDTSAARGDIEQILGGGDAARGSVLKAKTATEAEILAQGLRGRSEERRDAMEDLLSEVGEAALEMCLRKMRPPEVERVIGADLARSWPSMSPEQVFEQVSVDVRGGSTGKPDKLQDQDRWTKLMPVIEKTMQQVGELRAKGQNELAQALIELTRETLRRFDERIDLDTFLPPAPEDGQPDPVALAAENAQLKQQGEAIVAEMKDLQTQVEKAFVSAAAQVATTQDPQAAAAAFLLLLQGLKAIENGEKTPVEVAQSIPAPPPEPPPEDGAGHQPHQPPLQ